MKFRLCIILPLLLLVCGCFNIEHKPENSKDLAIFDSSTPAIKQYHLLNWENYEGKLDTCKCNLWNDTLRIDILTKNFSSSNGLRVQYMHDKYMGYFFQSDDFSHYQFGDDPRIKSYIEIPVSDLRIEFIKGGKKDDTKQTFSAEDSLQGYIWATFKVYDDGGTACRDRFEGFFNCIIKKDSVVNRFK
jgi:hypothetical protein